jgi:hypothetical protein
MLAREWLWVGLMIASVTGCGGEDDDDASSGSSGLAGIYETTSDEFYQPCTAEPVSTGIQPPFFRIVDESLFNGLFISVYRCSSTDPESCDDEETGSPLIFLAEETSAGVFHSESSSRAPSGDDCTATWFGEDVKKSTDGVTLTAEERSGQWSGADCTADFNDAIVEKTKALPCFQREVRKSSLIERQ